LGDRQQETESKRQETGGGNQGRRQGQRVGRGGRWKSGDMRQVAETGGRERCREIEGQR
jgi:hypothetical protein